MTKNTKQPTAKPDRKERAKARARRRNRMPKGVKQLIGYDSMLRNGVAYLGDDRWSASIAFDDINYQLCPEAHQMEIIERWAKLINSFDAGQSVQIASYTRSRRTDEILRDISIPPRGDGLDQYRMDYNKLAEGKLETVGRNTNTFKTLTISIREPDKDVAVGAGPVRPAYAVAPRGHYIGFGHFGMTSHNAAMHHDIIQVHQLPPPFIPQR